MKNAICAFVVALLFFSITQVTNAAQYGPYEGPRPSLSILVDKLIAKPYVTTSGITEWEFVDNISGDTHRFRANSPIFFQVVVKNTSEQTLENVVVKDFVPDFLEPFEGDGSFDENTRVVTIDAGNFAAGEEKTFVVNMRVRSEDSLPSDQSLLCPANKVRAETGNISDEDNSTFCIEKKSAPVPVSEKGGIAPVEEIPTTGPTENMLLVIGVSALIALTGLKLAHTEGKYLKKKS